VVRETISAASSNKTFGATANEEKRISHVSG